VLQRRNLPRTLDQMKNGFVIPWGDARDVADLAHIAEDNGWDGIFVWEPLYGVDAWVSLAAAAMTTKRIKLGTLLTPLARMRPWKIASEAATLDRLSNGRVILAAGLGAPDVGWADFGEPLGGSLDRKVRAAMMDECLTIMTALWRGEPFTFDGTYYKVKPATFPHQPPSPVQQPIPIWMVGYHGSEKSMGRAIQYQGLLPTYPDHFNRSPDEQFTFFSEMAAWVRAHRADSSAYDFVVEGNPSGKSDADYSADKASYAAAGATWWVEGMWDAVGAADAVARVRARLVNGP
jgi:alkanesulfonate monooxygenase SsuD/methylene tetrahydromethanopterin reductase-like flavin-dependent oxidoreductase (luciferase family)